MPSDPSTKQAPSPTSRPGTSDNGTICFDLTTVVTTNTAVQNPNAFVVTTKYSIAYSQVTASPGCTVTSVRNIDGHFNFVFNTGGSNGVQHNANTGSTEVHCGDQNFLCTFDALFTQILQDGEFHTVNARSKGSCEPA